MDHVSVNWHHTALILAAAFLIVFVEAAFPGLRRAIGAQIDLLPALMVFAAMTAGFATVVLLAMFGGLWLDALSANPLGISILPLLVTGLMIRACRGIVLRSHLTTRYVMGLAASAAVPFLTVLALLGSGREPILRWGTLWQWAVMAVGGAALTPIVFLILEWILRALDYPIRTELSFRPDREIKRGPFLENH